MNNILCMIFERITSYELLVNFIPGTLLVALIDNFTKWQIWNDNALVSVVITYFIGVIISRIGSLVLEPLLKKKKILKIASYKSFINAEAQDKKISILLLMSNMYRSLAVVPSCFLIIKGCDLAYAVIDNELVLNVVFSILLACFVTIVLVKAIIKQNMYVVERVNEVEGSDSKN